MEQGGGVERGEPNDGAKALRKSKPPLAVHCPLVPTEVQATP